MIKRVDERQSLIKEALRFDVVCRDRMMVTSHSGQRERGLMVFSAGNLEAKTSTSAVTSREERVMEIPRFSNSERSAGSSQRAVDNSRALAASDWLPAASPAGFPCHASVMVGVQVFRIQLNRAIEVSQRMWIIPQQEVSKSTGIVRKRKIGTLPDGLV